MEQKEILLIDLKTNKLIKAVYTQEDLYKKGLNMFKCAEKQGKVKIIPQDINNFIKTGSKI